MKSTRALCNSLEATLEVAKPLRIRLSKWFQDLPQGLLDASKHRQAHDLNGQGALHLAYITAKIELFRAMLRPKNDANVQASSAIRTGAIAVAREVFDFLETMDANHLEAFWPSCK